MEQRTIKYEIVPQEKVSKDQLSELFKILFILAEAGAIIIFCLPNNIRALRDQQVMCAVYAVLAMIVGAIFLAISVALQYLHKISDQKYTVIEITTVQPTLDFVESNGQ